MAEGCSHWASLATEAEDDLAYFHFIFIGPYFIKQRSKLISQVRTTQLHVSREAPASPVAMLGFSPPIFLFRGAVTLSS